MTFFDYFYLSPASHIQTHFVLFRYTHGYAVLFGYGKRLFCVSLGNDRNAFFGNADSH